MILDTHGHHFGYHVEAFSSMFSHTFLDKFLHHLLMPFWIFWGSIFEEIWSHFDVRTSSLTKLGRLAILLSTVATVLRTFSLLLRVYATTDVNMLAIITILAHAHRAPLMHLVVRSLSLDTIAETSFAGFRS